MYVGILILYSVVTVPYRIGFDENMPLYSFWWIFDIFVDSCFAMDMVFTFTTGRERE